MANTAWMDAPQVQLNVYLHTLACGSASKYLCS